MNSAFQASNEIWNYLTFKPFSSVITLGQGSTIHSPGNIIIQTVAINFNQLS